MEEELMDNRMWAMYHLIMTTPDRYLAWCYNWAKWLQQPEIQTWWAHYQAHVSMRSNQWRVGARY